MSSKMVSLHFPVETHDNVSVRRAVGGAKTDSDRHQHQTKSTVCERVLTSDGLEGQQFNVFPSRVCRAVVLGESAAVLLVCALHLLHCLRL